tara:strand:- start:1259 stop:2143 length:885 start_codon:yes stop_codon:yes gene_type:complete
MIIDLSELTDGFSSKLRVISYFLAIIKIKKLKKNVYIYEKKSFDAPFLFTDLCSIKKFKVIKLKNKPSSEIIFTPYNYSDAINSLKKKYLIKKKQNNKFFFISDLSYKNFIPNFKIRSKIKKINLPNKFTGFHIRATDREINIKNFIKKIQFKEMMFDFHTKHMIRNILKNSTFNKLLKNTFICSDDKVYKNEMINLFSSKLNIFFHNSKFDIKKHRQTNGIDFVTELFCLSKSHTIISNVGGNVVTTAYLLSNKKIKVYKWSEVLNLFIILKYLVLLIFWIKNIKNLIISKIF